MHVCVYPNQRRNIKMYCIMVTKFENLIDERIYLTLSNIKEEIGHVYPLSFLTVRKFKVIFDHN